MKTFHKTAAPPPRAAFMKSLFRIFDRISGTYGFLNKRYEIRLTPPPFVKKFHKIPDFFKGMLPLLNPSHN